MSEFQRRTSSAPPSDPTQTWDRPLKVQFIHGLESGPGSSKAAYLDRFFDAQTPAMDTRDFEATFAPDVLVGSSFGGAVALALLQRGIFSGPTVLLAPAHTHFGVEARIPAGARVVIVHGSRDDVVSIEDSRRLAASGGRGVDFVEVDDEHRLASLLEGDALATVVRRALLVPT
jgi:pimeloyl-ACP methyl ester carboxylesterase